MSIPIATLLKTVAPFAVQAWKEWLEVRKEKRALRALARRARYEQAVDDLNADLDEYHRTGKVPYDATISKHVQGRQPTTRITIKSKHEQGKPVGITAESEP